MERSDSHQIEIGEGDGFREGLNPSYMPLNLLRFLQKLLQWRRV